MNALETADQNINPFFLNIFFSFYVALLSGILIAFLLWSLLTSYLINGRNRKNINSLFLFVSILGAVYCFNLILLNNYHFREIPWPLFAFLIYYFTINLSRSDDCLVIVRLLLFVLAIQFVYSIVYYFSDIYQFHTPHFGARTSGTFDNPSSLYPFCVIAIPIAISLLIFEKSILWRLCYICITGLSIISLILTFSRAGWIAVVLSMSYLAFRLNLKTSPLFRKYIALIALLLLACTFLIRAGGDPEKLINDRSSIGRIEIWRSSILAISQQPFLGYGIDSYPYVQHRFASTNLIKLHPINIEPKSLFLNIAIDVGIPGLMIFLLVVHKFVGCFNTQIGNGVGLGIQYALLGIIIAGFFDTPIMTSIRLPQTMIFYVLLGLYTVLIQKTLQKITC